MNLGMAFLAECNCLVIKSENENIVDFGKSGYV